MTTIFNSLSSNTLSIIESASQPVSPPAGTGVLWTRNDATQSLMFTDDSSTDYCIYGVKGLCYEHDTMGSSQAKEFPHDQGIETNIEHDFYVSEFTNSAASRNISITTKGQRIILTGVSDSGGTAVFNFGALGNPPSVGDHVSLVQFTLYTNKARYKVQTITSTTMTIYDTDASAVVAFNGDNVGSIYVADQVIPLVSQKINIKISLTANLFIGTNKVIKLWLMKNGIKTVSGYTTGTIGSSISQFIILDCINVLANDKLALVISTNAATGDNLAVYGISWLLS